jgi:hypothetical protein
MAGSLVYWQEEQYSHTNEQEQARLSRQAETIEKNVGRMLYSVNRALEGIREALPSRRSAASKPFASQELQLICDTLVGIGSISILNAQGLVTSSNKAELIGRDLSARDYFQNALNNHNAKTLYVSPPFTTLFNQFAVALIRNITRSDGAFAGVVVASIEPAYFDVLLGSILYAPDVLSFMVHDNGKLFTYSPAMVGTLGRNLLVPGSLYRRFRDSNTSASVLIANPDEFRQEESRIALVDLELLGVRIAKTVAPPFFWARGKSARFSKKFG